MVRTVMVEVACEMLSLIRFFLAIPIGYEQSLTQSNSAQAQARMKQVDPLALLVHKFAPQQFDIAQGFTYISIRDQMNRAAMVVDALVESGHLDEGHAVPTSTSFHPSPTTVLSVQLVIFGAGAAGLAAAMAAKKRNLSFVLVERGSSIPGGVMASNAQRYVSVSMYEWPNVSSSQHGYAPVLASRALAISIPFAQALAGVESSHSQATITAQPLSSKLVATRVSRATFLPNFSIQKGVLLFGVVAMEHPTCLCQKQPCTKTTVLYFGKTKSGLPGKPAPWRRYRSPRP